MPRPVFRAWPTLGVDVRHPCRGTPLQRRRRFPCELVFPIRSTACWHSSLPVTKSFPVLPESASRVLLCHLESQCIVESLHALGWVWSCPCPQSVFQG